MLISLSKSKKPEPWHHKHFNVFDAGTMKSFANKICENHWSPIVWKNNIRLSDNFLECGLCVLDFDDGQLTVEDAAKHCRALDLLFLIGTTKSHMIQKGDLPPCDRFRLILMFEYPITSAEHFKQNMQYVARLWPTCDKGALDAARKYAPCKHIVDGGPGRAISVQPLLPPKPKWETRYDYIDGDKKVPTWVQDILTQGIAPGERNRTLYRVCANLKKYGFTKEETLVLISESNIEMEKREVETVVRSAYR